MEKYSRNKLIRFEEVFSFDFEIDKSLSRFQTKLIQRNQIVATRRACIQKDFTRIRCDQMKKGDFHLC